MDKLYAVKKSLEKNREVIVVRTFEMNYLSGRKDLRNHIIDFCVAPKIRLYEVKELQEFMVSLIPKGLKPKCMDIFSQQDKRGDLFLGKLYFDEEVKEDMGSIQRRILISPFPSESLAENLLEGKLSPINSIGADDFRRYRGRLV